MRQGLLNLLLTTDPAQRLRLRQTLLAMALMGLSVPMLHYAAWLDDAGPPGALIWVWTAYSVGGMLLAYLAIRSGWSRRLADPSLTVWQMVFAVSSAVAGYALAGPLRGAVFPVLTLILMFGMFQLHAGNALAVSLYALAMFGLAMGTMAWLNPAVYPPAIEIGHFLMLACMLPAVATLAGRLSRIRRRLTEQKQELTQALAQIQAMATRDDLTGLLNRRHMQTLLEQETQRCLRSGRGYCLALLDIDHFKCINDTHGHSAGDAMLRAFAVAAQGAIRGSDVLARWGARSSC